MGGQAAEFVFVRYYSSPLDIGFAEGPTTTTMVWRAIEVGRMILIFEDDDDRDVMMRGFFFVLLIRIAAACDCLSSNSCGF